MILIPLLCASYLIGALPTGLAIGKLLKGVDVRRLGSGNVGATNVFRVVGKLPGAMVLATDIAKGWLPVAWFSALAVSWGSQVSLEILKPLLGVVAVAGHIFNPFLQFRGGRGVATSLGVLFALDRRIAFGALVIWILVAWWTRYVSVASIAAALVAPYLMAILALPTLWIFSAILISLVIIARHRPNILRLLHREEPKIGQQSSLPTQGVASP